MFRHFYPEISQDVFAVIFQYAFDNEKKSLHQSNKILRID